MGTQSRRDPVRSLPWLTPAWLLRLFVLVAVCGSSQGRAQSAAVALRMPSAIAYDTQGTLYIAERRAHVIRKFAADGSLTTLVGTGVQGFAGDGGAGTAARLDSPSGVAVDSAGNVYVSDTHNQRVRKLSAATGLLESVAGTGVHGFAGDGGAAGSALLDTPTALAISAAGDLYIADTGNHRVRKISAGTGVITTVAGTGRQGFSGDGGAAVAAAVDSPAGLALDGSGNLYIADTHNQRVRRVDAVTGVITTLAGVGRTGAGLPAESGDGGPAVSAALALPRGLTVGSDGSVYVADSANNRIRRIAADGTVTTVAGAGSESFAGDAGLAVNAALAKPGAVALSPGGLLTLADTGNQRVRQVDGAAVIHTITGVGLTAGSNGLTLTGPVIVPYGTGSILASVQGAAVGNVTFVDAATAPPVTLGTAALSGGAATFSTAALSAGAHTITAAYSGRRGVCPYAIEPLGSYRKSRHCDGARRPCDAVVWPDHAADRWNPERGSASGCRQAICCL